MLVRYNPVFVPCKDVFNPNVTIFQSNCAEGLHFSAFHLNRTECQSSRVGKRKRSFFDPPDLSQSSSVMEVEGSRSPTAALLVGCACCPLDSPTFLCFLSLHYSSTALPASHCVSGGPVVAIRTRLSSLSLLRQLRRFVLINFN